MNLFDDPYGADDALEAYKAAKNPPEFGAGQDDILFAPLTGNEENINVDSFGSMFSPQPMPGMSPFGQQTQPPQEQVSLEERLFEGGLSAVVKGSKGLWHFLTHLFQTFKITTPQGWLATSVRFKQFGYAILSLGVFASVMSIFISSIHNTLWLVTLGIILSIGGLSASILLSERVKSWIDETGQAGTTTDNLHYVDEVSVPVQEESADDFFSGFSDSSDNYEEVSEPLGDYTEYVETVEEVNQDYEDISQLYQDTEEVLVADEPVDLESAISDLDMAVPGMQSRIYLYEQFSRILRSNTPNFSTLREVDMNEQLFQDYLTLLMNSASREGFNEYDYELDSMYENSFMVKLVVKANKKFKADTVALAIENQVKYNEKTGKAVAPNVFTTYQVIGGLVHINIIKDKPPLFTVKDVWLENKEFIQNIENVMPVALGSDEFGDSVVVDFYKVDGLAISGMKGTGKSWMAQSIISQLSMFNSPNQVQFIIADPKGDQGDFNSMNFPHIIEKVQSTEDTMRVLRWLMEEEVPRRRAILGQYGLSNIKVLHQQHPDVNLPFLYIVVEEMMNIGNRLKKHDKEAYQEYRIILSEIINNLRYVGVRLFALSQRLVDDAVPKDAKVGIDLRMTAGSDPSEIEQVTETKQKDFQYNISGKVGRYAIRTPEYNGGQTSFMIGSVLGPTDLDNKQIHKFIEVLWNKLDPVQVPETVEVKIQKELESASTTEMDDILNQEIQLW